MNEFGDWYRTCVHKVIVSAHRMNRAIESYCTTYCQLSWLLLTPFIGNGLKTNKEKNTHKYTHFEWAGKREKKRSECGKKKKKSIWTSKKERNWMKHGKLSETELSEMEEVTKPRRININVQNQETKNRL